MGMMGDNLIVTELKKNRDQTNERLDAILAELRRGNQLLAHLAGVTPVDAIPPLDPGASYPRTVISWDASTAPADGKTRHGRHR